MIKGTKHTKETCKKMSSIRLKNPNRYWLNKKRPNLHSQEAKSKLSKLLKEITPKENNSVNWKGSKATYSAIHKWIVKKMGNPSFCEHCGVRNLNSRQYHWANIDHKYNRVLEDWKRLCAKCHKEYDKKVLHVRCCNQYGDF